MRRIRTTIFALLLFVAPWDLLAQDTRAERLQEQRMKKSQNLQPPERSSLERFFYEFKERRILERYQAGFKGFHPLIGGLSTGSGWALGTQFRKAEILDGLIDFSVSGQASFAAYQKYEMNVEAPRLANEHLSLSFNFRQRNYPQEDFFGIGSGSEQENRTSFRLEDTQYTASLGVRPVKNLMLGARGGILNTNTASGTDRRFPSIEQVFTAATTPALETQPDYRFGGAFAQYDKRDAPFNP